MCSASHTSLCTPTHAATALRSRDANDYDDEVVRTWRPDAPNTDLTNDEISLALDKNEPGEYQSYTVWVAQDGAYRVGVHYHTMNDMVRDRAKGGGGVGGQRSHVHVPLVLTCSADTALSLSCTHTRVH